MKLYHATPRTNVESILKLGLEPHRTNGKIKAVWLHTKSRREWAILHTQKRHGIGAEDIVIIAVNVPRQKLTRRWRGLWSCPHTLPVRREDITEANLLADSPINN